MLYLNDRIMHCRIYSLTFNNNKKKIAQEKNILSTSFPTTKYYPNKHTHEHKLKITICRTDIKVNNKVGTIKKIKLQGLCGTGCPPESNNYLKDNANTETNSGIFPSKNITKNWAIYNFNSLPKQIIIHVVTVHTV